MSKDPNLSVKDRAAKKARHEQNKAALSQWNKDVANDSANTFKPRPDRKGGYAHMLSDGRR